MNLGDKSNNEILFLNFNQEFSCVSIGTKSGYRIYNCDPFGCCYSKQPGGIGIVEMLFCTSLVALVGGGETPAFSPRQLRIINTKRQTTICELTFPTAILAVKMNRRRLIVVLEEQIYLYDISNMKLLHTIDTNPNPNAICVLSPSSENCFIAYPARSANLPFSPNSGPSNSLHVSGDVELFDALGPQTTNIVQAHKSPVSCLSMNSEGTLLATASEKGTVVRIFSTLDATKIYQFRRGSYPARIYSMSFNIVSSLLCVSSDTETVHIFKLSANRNKRGSGNGNNTYDDEMNEKKPTRRSSVGQMIRRSSTHLGRNIAGSVGSYLPDVITEIWEPTRNFAQLKLPSAGIKSLVALSSTTPQVMVVTSEGCFYQYNIDLENGGECVLLREDSFIWCPTIQSSPSFLKSA
ncbi:hypothetical protein RO3G_14016 [Rhizopus delemar RA 99-880]|uniref:Autophagy-related protein 18 n=1 Tax=Rhizopus delemar (strain RA 99-880 / ATCC MYA-4621 / FGSC 9543 / NRRL 43880) TaxID=246409 RepID=I1CLH5_RHIO9|nr:hypothetical protein RO3G_14016 [Rhizopus delemar RA 99-880]|eukprot:EIE89305.1 hypothetical protein RO3G_14016 [Rhizopus delemar RA 99-880]